MRCSCWRAARWRAKPGWSRRCARALGNRLAGVFAKIGAHTPRGDVVAAANAARAAGADLLVTLGGGSVTDAAKMVAFCLGNGVTDPAAARRLSRPGRRRRQDRAPGGKAARQSARSRSRRRFGRRIHRFGRLHRHGAPGQGELRPSADDAEECGARPARHASTRRNGCSCRPGSAPSTMRSRTSARRSASRSRKAPRYHALETARPRPVAGSRATRSTSTRGSIASSAPGCR